MARSHLQYLMELFHFNFDHKILLEKSNQCCLSQFNVELMTFPNGCFMLTWSIIKGKAFTFSHIQSIHAHVGSDVRFDKQPLKF